MVRSRSNTMITTHFKIVCSEHAGDQCQSVCHFTCFDHAYTPPISQNSIAPSCSGLFISSLPGFPTVGGARFIMLRDAGSGSLVPLRSLNIVLDTPLCRRGCRCCCRCEWVRFASPMGGFNEARRGACSPRSFPLDFLLSWFGGEKKKGGVTSAQGLFDFFFIEVIASRTVIIRELGR